MKLAYSTLGAPGWSFEQAVEAVAAYGYEGIEIRLVDGELVEPDLSAEQRQRVERALRDAGVPAVALDTSLRAVGPGDSDAFVGDIASYVDIAAQWGAPMLRVFGGPLPDDEAGRREALDEGARRLERAATTGRGHGVRIAVETHDSLSSAKAVAELLGRVDDPWVGAVYDSHHPHRMGETPKEVLDLLGPRVMLVQVKDARRRAGDDGWDLVLLGQGEVPVRQLLELLPSYGYDGWISVEWEKKWHPEIPEPEEALPQHRKLLASWLGSLPEGENPTEA